MTDITEIEKELFTDLRKERLENIKEIEKLPEGIDKNVFFAKIAQFSKYKSYIVIGEEAVEKVAKTRKFVINKGRVTINKKIAVDTGWDSTKEEQATMDKRAELGLSIMQRDLQVAFAEELDNYLDNNPSVKIANAFFINFDSLRWSTATLIDDQTFERVLNCSFLLRFNMYID